MKRKSMARRTFGPDTRYRPELFPLEDRLPPGDTLGILTGLGLLGPGLVSVDASPALAGNTVRPESFLAGADRDATNKLEALDMTESEAIALVPASTASRPISEVGAASADDLALFPDTPLAGHSTMNFRSTLLPVAGLSEGWAAESLAHQTGWLPPALPGSTVGQRSADGSNGGGSGFLAGETDATPFVNAAAPLRFDRSSGRLAVWANAGNTVREGFTSAGFLTVNLGGRLHSSDPAAAAYDSALAGATSHSLTSLRLEGSNQATLELGAQHLAGGLAVRADGPVRVQGDISAAGPLAITAPAVTVRGSLHAPVLGLASTGLVNVDKGAEVSAGRVDVSARVLVNVGAIRADVAAGQVTLHAGNVLNAGRISADSTQGDGGTVTVDFTGSYLDTAAARTSADGLHGGRVRIDGGTTGRLYTSGTQQATGPAAGGTVALTGGAVLLVASAVDASGAGGVLDIGGSAQAVWASAATTVRANGGRVEMQAGQVAPAPQGFPGLIDPHPGVGGAFGFSITPLPNGNLLVTNPEDNLAAPAGGAIYLMSGRTGALLSALVGAEANDRLGNARTATASPVTPPNAGPGGDQGGDGNEDGPPPPLGGGPSSITPLANGNYVVASPNWNGNVGAVTWGDGTVGVSGVADATNSLVGSQPNDRVGSGRVSPYGVTALNNGNYVVVSPDWNGGNPNGLGAVTWGDGTIGVTGTVNASNSLVGSNQGDRVGYGGVTALNNGNYVVRSPNWNGGFGAVTWGDGTAGVTGAVDASNSLVGSQANDQVGDGGVTALSNGNYVVASPDSNGGYPNGLGAVTWGDGTAGVSGVVDASNSLVGSHPGDGVGYGVTALNNGNYVVVSPDWNGGFAHGYGAVTWEDGTAGTSGVVDASNSLVGSRPGDLVGYYGIKALSNGNYVVLSPYWNGGFAGGYGAVTWEDGTAGTSGVVDASNSLVGSHPGDGVGNRVTALNNGNYVVASPYWNGGFNQGHGAVTWGDGTAGVSGVVDVSNSLVGSHTDDRVGYDGVTALSNGNYMVNSPDWNGNVGAVTWEDGTVGVSGVVDASNSLVGSQPGDVGGNAGVTPLNNGNYVIASPGWHGGYGAVTWGDGTAGVSGVVDASNSLVGSHPQDRVGSGIGPGFVGAVTALNNGNYVVLSPGWNGGSSTGYGAVTWGDGTAGVSGVVDASNSLVGSHPQNQVGSAGVTALNNGNYVVASPYWNGYINGFGAVTWGDGTVGVSGVVDASNSFVGSHTEDLVGYGGVMALSNGNYVVASPFWNGGGGSFSHLGAVTWEDGTAGVSGVVDVSNSLVGSHTGDRVGSGVTVLPNGNYLVNSPYWDSNRGAVTWADGLAGTTVGVVDDTNSLVG